MQKLLFFFYIEMISAYIFGEMCFNSNFYIFESALYKKSGSMPLTDVVIDLHKH